MKSFIEKFEISKLKVCEFNHWVLSVRPLQVTIGSLILSLKRDCDNIAQLNEEESKELSKIFLTVDKLYSTTFKPNKVNYLLLMMVDNQVHFHIIPRYQNPVEFQDEIYNDNEWPKPADILNTLELEREKIEAIQQYLVESLYKRNED